MKDGIQKRAPERAKAPAKQRPTAGTLATKAARRAGESERDEAWLEQRERHLIRIMRIVGLAAAVFMATVLGVIYRYVDYDFSHAFATGFMKHKIAYRQDPFARGVLHYNGYGDGGVNHTEAMNHFLQAASTGERRAKTALGLMFFKGEGVAENVKTAARWFEQAAAEGEVRAMSALCFIHYKGHIDETRDFLIAAKWCRKAADVGDAKAQFNLGVMVAHGQGVEQDYVAAYQWLTLAMDTLHDDALSARDALVTRMTSREVEAGQEAANEWRKAHRMLQAKNFLPDLSKSWGAITSSSAWSSLSGSTSVSSLGNQQQDEK